MFKEILHIIRITRPRHLVRAIYLTSHTFRKLKYHYRSVHERMFIDFLSKKWNCTPYMVDSAYEDLNKNQKLWDEINQNLSIYVTKCGAQTTRELSCLYLLVRLIKPNRVVETGVKLGASSTYILRALEDNEKGKLYSIDLPSHDLPQGKESGCLVPEELRDRWDLRIGDAKEMLVPLLKEIGEVDFFVHDSLHTYNHMMWEYKNIWLYLRDGGLFLSHDVFENEAFPDFMKEANISWTDYRLFHVLGGFRKPSRTEISVDEI